MAKKLKRQTFETSRLLEFFTEEELTMQIGHDEDLWPVALVKELIDNALDACESVGRPPKVKVVVENDKFSVEDNGPGLPAKTIRRSLDYLVRVSDKTFYVSPTRGQLGNALKCVYAAPFVDDGEHGCVWIETKGSKHIVDVSLNRIAQKPELTVKRKKSVCKNGTKVSVFWPKSAGLLTAEKNDDFYNEMIVEDLVAGYAMFNPHLTIELIVKGKKEKEFEATDPSWQKWKPDQPTSPYWYDAERLRDLIAAYLTSEMRKSDKSNPKTVREFIAEFRGLTGTAKQKRVLEETSLSGKRLGDLVKKGDVFLPMVEKLLKAMQKHSRPVKPSKLGILGKKHFKRHLINHYSVAPKSNVHYKRIAATDERTGLPHVIEAVFTLYKEEAEYKKKRTSVTGLNWAPTIDAPVREFDELLGHIDEDDPVVAVFHIARPRFDFIDKGKGRINV